MPRTNRSLVALVTASVVLWLAGCRSVNVDEGYVLDSAKGKGLMVVSLTQAGVPTAFNMFVAFRGVGHDFRSQVPVSDAFASSDWKCPLLGTATEAEPCGRLAIVELPQGEYEFYSWNGSGTTGAMTTNVRAQREFSKRFKITAGSAVYLGNIHFSVSGPVQFGGRYSMVVRDMRTRDLPLLASKGPRITSENIVYSILPN